VCKLVLTMQILIHSYIAYLFNTGSLPSELGDLSLLRYLYVDNNDLMGLVPSELFTESSRLTEVWLHHNHFSGTIPPEMAELPELTDFFIDRKFATSI